MFIINYFLSSWRSSDLLYWKSGLQLRTEALENIFISRTTPDNKCFPFSFSLNYVTVSHVKILMKLCNIEVVKVVIRYQLS